MIEANGVDHVVLHLGTRPAVPARIGASTSASPTGIGCS